MSIFDPIGLLSHALIRPKVLIQESWRSGIGWDEYLPDALFNKWKNWLTSFLELAGLAIPRPYCRDMENVKEIQMHVLVDASESAFAAAIYFRMQLEHHVECVFITSKSKVAPNKVLSIPRLELQAAVLGSRLAAYVRAEHRLKIDSQVFWSDSQTTLSWINCTDLQRLKPFVGVRVSEIHELSKAGEWRKVPTQMNVADDATKWNEDTRYRADDRWFQGPSFLIEPESEWPTFAKQELPSPSEMKAPVFVVTSPEICYDGIPLEQFSSYDKLVRVFAIMLKFIDCCSAKHDKIELFTSYKQINQKPKIIKTDAYVLAIAEALIVRRAQHEAFPMEYEALKAGKMLPKKSPLVPLNPTLDEMKVMRLGGRIRRVPDVAESSRFPAILPNKHRLTELIVQHYHEKFAHAFQESVLAATRHKFWIIHGRQAVRRVKTNCQRCKNKRATPQPTLMGELPLCRLDWKAKPFFHSGMDLYGPLKAIIFRRPIKCYVMLFTCMVTRAIHLELAMSLNTDDSILCLRNFLNRRGPVAHFYCDNGTNWHGSHNELFKELQNCGPQLRRANEDYTIEWHFQPPAASHFGGAYERMIQAVQKAMDSILADRSPRLETLRSALIECENVVNSRPLTHVPMEAEDDDPLTPNDLLKMHPNRMPPPGEFVSQDVNLRKQWRVAQQLANEFWVKWRQYYLPELARRTKWHQTSPAIKPNDIVLIVDGNLPRNEWRKGRVVRTIAGEDGLARVAIVKHNNKEYTRPIMKLAKLDVM